MSTTHLIGRGGAESLADVHLRYSTPVDVDQVVAMHARCSPESLSRRFHVPLPGITPRFASRLLMPVEGWCLVAERGGSLVAQACVAPVSASTTELGLLVEDAHQGRGLGTRMLRHVALDAAGRGFRRMRCLVQPENLRVLETVRRAGLLGRISCVDGLAQVEVPLSGLADDLPRPA